MVGCAGRIIASAFPGGAVPVADVGKNGLFLGEVQRGERVVCGTDEPVAS